MLLVNPNKHGNIVRGALYTDRDGTPEVYQISRYTLINDYRDKKRK